MAAASSNNPISVDYTGRDYYALRDQLIKRVQERVPDWRGSDPNDFGLALVESFSYMGDLVNYYIDRVANESYMLTATQRDTLLNIASMYGYKPASYVSASTTLDITDITEGYKGEIGGAIIEGGDATHTLGNYAKIIVPNDHPFVVDDIIKVNSMPNETSPTTIGDKTLVYNTSVFNGTFPVVNVGYDNFGKNVVWYRPSATITGITQTDPTTFVVTLSETNRTITPYSGQKVLITGVTVASGDNYNGQWVLDSTTSISDTQPEITMTIKTTASDTVADVTVAKVVSGSIYYSAWNDFIVGEKVTITGATDTSFNLTDVAVTGTKSIEAAVSRATTDGTTVTYYTSEQFAVGDYVTIRRISSVGNELATKDLGYNLTDKSITSVSATSEVGITGVTGSTPSLGLITYQTAAGHGFEIGDYVTMSGIVNVATDLVTATDVLNLKSAKIVAKTDFTFTVEGDWTVEYDTGASVSPTATLYAFTLTEAVTGNIKSTGSVVTEYFTVDTPGGFTGTDTTFTSGAATPQVGGTWVSGGEVVYAEIPTLVVSGPFVTSVGSTVVPKGTQVRTQVTVEGGVKDIIFSTQADAAVPFRETASVLAFHGEDISLRAANAADTTAKAYDIAGELLGYSTGDADQKFALKEVQVDPRTVRVFIDTGTEWEEWSQVEHIQDYTPSSQIFEISIQANEEVTVVFGDGISGAIPPREAGIKAVYIAGGGVVGNVAANSLTTWDTVLGVDADTIRKMRVTNATAATGGADPESNDSIRYNAPRALRSLNRAVTLSDFASLALTVDGIVKSNATASSRSSVAVYIAPNATGSEEETPGIDGMTTTTQMESYKRLVAQYLDDKKQIGTTVTVLEPVYSYVHVALKYSVLPQYNPSTIATSIKKAIVSNFSYDNVDFADVITPEEVEFKLRQVEGVSNVRVTGLYRLGGEGRNSLIGEPYELFVFTEAEIEVDESETESRVNTITFVALDGDGVALDAPAQAQVVVSPTVNGEVYSYTLTLPATTQQVEVSVTTLGLHSTVSVNDKLMTGSTIIQPVMISEGVVNLYVTVTAEDGITVRTYRFKVSINS